MKRFNLLTKGNLFITGVFLALSSGLAFSAPVDIDYSVVSGSVITTGLISAIMAVGLVKFGPQIAKWGLAKLTSMFGG